MTACSTFFLLLQVCVTVTFGWFYDGSVQQEIFTHTAQNQILYNLLSKECPDLVRLVKRDEGRKLATDLEVLKIHHEQLLNILVQCREKNKAASRTSTTTKYQPPVRITTEKPLASSSINCDFEYSFCGWRQVVDTDTFDWSRATGSTASKDTGPAGDYNTGNGYYVYTESSAPRDKGDIASLRFDFGKTVTEGCFTLQYNMYGKLTGELRIDAYDVNENITNLWSLSGPQGTEWHQLAVNITQPLQQVEITAIVGGYATSDTAIDDVKFYSVPC